MSASMSYSISSSMPDGRRMSYNIHWKGKLEPIAVCGDFRDAERIRDALNGQAAPEWDWISVEDRLPEDSTVVVIATQFGKILTAFRQRGAWFSYPRSMTMAQSSITHWCDPIPPSDQLNNQQPTTNNPEVNNAD